MYLLRIYDTWVRSSLRLGLVITIITNVKDVFNAVQMIEKQTALNSF